MELNENLGSAGEEKPRPAPLLFKWKWGFAGAGLLLLIAFASYFVFLRSGRPLETFPLSYEDSLALIGLDIESNPGLEQSFDQAIAASIDEAVEEDTVMAAPDMGEDPFFWESLSDEDMKYLEAELKKEMKSQMKSMEAFHEKKYDLIYRD